ncbi:hypothetical protein DY000_02064052 [Brassica cretica]|uniref:GOLD domain-containing protein n=1 Tax=Brassica cretica TaxID=69181 RepID=A0ABQ7B490_BRACR|nr:hypothetical protein DY000_02064052 [Brassica cretica]
MEADQSSCNHRITESRLNSHSSVSLPSLYAPARFRRDQSDQVKTNEATHAEASKNVNVLYFNVLYLLIATCFICILQVKVENRAWKVDVVKWSGALEWSIHGESGEQGMESRFTVLVVQGGEVEWSIGVEHSRYWSGAFTSDRELLFHCLVSLSH